LSKHQPFEPRVDVPVNVTKIVSGLVFSEVRELDRSSASRRAAFAAACSRKRVSRPKREPFELLQKDRVQNSIHCDFTVSPGARRRFSGCWIPKLGATRRR